MERQEVLDKVISVVVSHFELDPAKVTGDLSFLTDIDADSIDFVELVLEMEDEFDIEISDEDAEGLKTINNTVDYIMSHSK
ncbi:acyl carrier protein [Weissella oryzae SG25]|uniref:Acyl carrier protein n=1 Tax=Weissella oryzae (strain DSM 25784 / JCM 18191 / LMG 30913 / SG25) TaxID=1329250 RepID=A0A069D008_WEIOS|nr:acyl carrier protein [Weissella oryzae]GAK30671.1 acyl carrier protein [Weissella oryzae SG25]